MSENGGYWFWTKRYENLFAYIVRSTNRRRKKKAFRQMLYANTRRWRADTEWNHAGS